MKIELFVITVIYTIVSTICLTAEKVSADTTSTENLTFLLCSAGDAFFNPDLKYSCDRIVLYVAGDCEITGETEWPCDDATKYLQNSGLQNERRLTQEEVVEDFRIVD